MFGPAADEDEGVLVPNRVEHVGPQHLEKNIIIILEKHNNNIINIREQNRVEHVGPQHLEIRDGGREGEKED